MKFEQRQCRNLEARENYSNYFNFLFPLIGLWLTHVELGESEVQKGMKLIVYEVEW